MLQYFSQSPKKPQSEGDSGNPTFKLALKKLTSQLNPNNFFFQFLKEVRVGMSLFHGRHTSIIILKLNFNNNIPLSLNINIKGFKLLLFILK